MKRTFDVVVSAAIVVVGLPFWLLIAALIKLDSRGPVIYSDTRVGLGERPFPMRKFRTMVAGAAGGQAALESANEASGALFKIRRRPARHPRRARPPPLLDRRDPERAQRPARRDVAGRAAPAAGARLRAPRAWHRRRSNVLPGMTGLWQIAGRSDLSFDDLVRLDFYYLENWSLWLDITILVKTLPAVLVQRGAY